MCLYDPPHEVREQDKLESMIALLERGESLPPVLVHGVDAYSGSHRLAAWREMEMEPDVIEMTDEQYNATIEAYGSERVSEYEDFLACASETMNLDLK